MSEVQNQDVKDPSKLRLSSAFVLKAEFRVLFSLALATTLGLESFNCSDDLFYNCPGVAQCLVRLPLY